MSVFLTRVVVFIGVNKSPPVLVLVFLPCIVEIVVVPFSSISYKRHGHNRKLYTLAHSIYLNDNVDFSKRFKSMLSIVIVTHVNIMLFVLHSVGDIKILKIELLSYIIFHVQ